MIDKNKIQGLINRLCMSEVNIRNICESFHFIAELNTEDIHPVESKVAELFCICSSEIKEEYICDEYLCNQLISAFDNIKLIINNIDKDSKDSNLITLRFLAQIQNLSSESCNPTESLQNTFADLCEKLDKMHCLFRLQKQGQAIFPIGKLLNFVIKKESFFTDKLDDITLNTLLLALEVFDLNKKDDVNKKIEALIKKCNLDCLKLLKKTDVVKIGGEQAWRNNFKKNGTLALLVPDENGFKVYIRHNDKSYFESEEYNADLQYEKNVKEKIIAYYTYIKYEGDLKHCSVDSLLQNNDLNSLKQLCKWIFCEKKMNIFLDDSIIKKNGEWTVANPFVANDREIISKSGQSYSTKNDDLIKNLLLPYSFYRIGRQFDYVMYSSIFSLLKINSDPIDRMFDFLKNDKSQNMQAGLINVWAENIDDYSERIIKLSSDYFSSVNYAKTQPDIIKKNINDILWLPYKFPIDTINSYLKREYGFDKTNDKTVHITTKQAFTGIIYVDESDNQISLDTIDSGDDELKNSGDFYAIYSTNRQTYYFRHDADKLIRLEKTIKENNEGLLDLETCSSIKETEIDKVIDLMKLQKGALTENCICNDFNSVAYLRLFHHLHYCQIFQQKKWNDFLKLMLYHQAISFNSFQSILQQIQNSNTLIVPKECRNTDNTLVSIIENYARLDSKRNRDFFGRKIQLIGEKYCLENNTAIKKIIILFDTLQMGKSTEKILNMYFDKTLNDGRICEYFCEEKCVTLTKIIEKNKASLEILVLFGSDDGKKYIDNFIQSSELPLRKAKEIKCLNKITKKSDDDFIQLAKEIYNFSDKMAVEEGFYPIIREFNQPKINIFPKQLLKPSCIASIFIKKPEFKN